MQLAIIAMGLRRSAQGKPRRVAPCCVCKADMPHFPLRASLKLSSQPFAGAGLMKPVRSAVENKMRHDSEEMSTDQGKMPRCDPGPPVNRSSQPTGKNHPAGMCATGVPQNRSVSTAMAA